MAPDATTAVDKLFWDDHFATKVTGIEIGHVEETTCECKLALTPRHCNAAGNVMGGVIFTLADLAFAVVMNHGLIKKVPKEELWMSLDSSIHFLRISKGTQLKANAVCLKKGRCTCLCEIKITDDTGKLIATIETTGIRSTQK